MGIQEQKLWKHLEVMATEDHAYMTAVEEICAFALNRAGQINITFPMYTLHNETHICNVLRLMADLLGDRLDGLTRDETAILILAACCHDIGMSVSEAEQQELLEDDRLARYLDARPWAYNIAYAKGGDTPELTPELLRDYLRSIHHERAADLLCSQEWPMVLVGKVERDDLIRVCQSHGEDIRALNELDTSNGVDLRLCAVLLRLADILDFDTSRAPKAVYDYLGFDGKDDPESEKSWEEWRKHMGSAGFDFTKVEDRSYPYDLPYAAKCSSMQQEQGIRSYLGWVNQELTRCAKALKRYAGKWNDLVLPDSVKANITAENYVSGQYRLTLDQSQVLNLLVGENLYSDPGVFVRELIQNAIDAVRTREKLDQNLPRGWNPQINIRTWMDEEGYHWFRIEDNGTGMDEHIILKHLLTVGSSYYNSDEFRKEKLRCGVEEYTPISRFGIGILSCFMGDKERNRVEISTKRFRTGDAYPPALRLSMQGLSGYYYMANKDKHHRPEPMIGQTEQEQKLFLTQPGTVVAVRTNLYQSGGCRSLKEIVDKYVVCPPVPIHYEGPEGAVDYTTEAEFMERVHHAADLSDQAREGEFVFHLSKEQVEKLRSDFPYISIVETPGIQLKCVALDRYTPSPYLKGVMVVAKTLGKIPSTMRTMRDGQAQVDFDIWSSTMNSFSVSIHECYGDLIIERRHFDLLVTLSTLPWFQTLFPIIADEGIVWASVHNGVYCGDTVPLFCSRYDVEEKCAAVLLLGDQYRPEQGLERNRIRQLPLEAHADLVLVCQQLMQEGYDTEMRHEALDMSFCAKLSAEKYLELLEKRPDFEKHLLIPTEERGTLTGADFLQAVKEKSGLTLYKGWKNGTLKERRTGDILNSLRLAWLQSHCYLRIRLERGKASAILAYRGQPAPEESRWKDFPPAFFLPPEENDCPYLAEADPGCRFACNANHPLSRFLIDNVDELKERTPGVFWDIRVWRGSERPPETRAPGVFWDILHSLAEDDADELIDRVNGLLDFLRSMPNSPISVPADLRLSKADFC